jgi:hypothetical protein
LEVNTEKRMGWRELLEHPLIKQKEAEPIGDRFLIQNNLEMPKVDEDLMMEPTTRVQLNEGLNLEELEQIARFKPFPER